MHRKSGLWLELWALERALPGLGLSQLCHQQEVRLETSFSVGLAEGEFNRGR